MPNLKQPTYEQILEWGLRKMINREEWMAFRAKYAETLLEMVKGNTPPSHVLRNYKKEAKQ